MTPNFDTFLAAALQGLLANPAIKDYTAEDYNDHAYAIAKDMLDLLNSAKRKTYAEQYCNTTIIKTDNDD